VKTPPVSPPSHTDADSAAPPPAPERDRLLVHGVTDDGAGLLVLRERKDHLEPGALRPLAPGRPIHGEVVQVRRHPEHPLLLEAQTVLSKPDPGPGPQPTSEPARKGPAQVATDRYRDNWDRIWAAPRGREPDRSN
jgi:hypothetical protein